jgi:formiminoglutamase
MMNYLATISRNDIQNLIRHREAEVKLGEHVQIISDGANYAEELKNSTCKFALFGIAEDIGVRANYGRGGTQSAWKPALENILNILNI